MDPFKEIPLLERLLISRKMHVIFATYLQNVITLPYKIASNVRAHLEFCRSGSNAVISTRIVNCIEQLTVD